MCQDVLMGVVEAHVVEINQTTIVYLIRFHSRYWGMFECLEYIRKEWRVLKNAPLSFMILIVLSISISGGAWLWYFKERIDAQEQHINRLSQALGIEKPDSIRPLMGLTNTEIKKKGLNVVQSIRSILSNHDNQNIGLSSQLRKREVTEVRFQELKDNEEKRAKEELAEINVQALMVHAELKQRVPGTAQMQFGLPDINPADKRDASINVYRAFLSSGVMSIQLEPLLANNIEEMALALP